LLLRVIVHPATVTDRGGARIVLEEVPTTFPALRRAWVDMGYQGTQLSWAQQMLGGR
jgi:putative transposase